jgi:diaminopimelate epimerase
MKFYKYHGLGNDYVLIDGFEERLSESHLPQLAKTICNRRTGVGSDGLLIIGPSDQADFSMRMHNPDGTEAEMCGNGIRCLAKFAYDHGRTDKLEMTIDTLAGVRKAFVVATEGKARTVRVAMGQPVFDRAKIPMTGSGEAFGEKLDLGGRELEIHCLSVGNPHCVVFVDDVDGEAVADVGPKVEWHRAFPNRINVQLAQILGPDEIKLRTWERGAGETLACGTGACAASVAAIRLGRVSSPVTVHLRGGDLKVEWSPGQEVMMTGPAVEVFSGELSQ